MADTPRGIDAAGTPQDDHVFAVFDNDSDARKAEDTLRQQGVSLERLHSSEHADALEKPAEDAGLLAKVGRLVKGIGGESNVAQRYADYLRDGKVVVTVPASNREAAIQLTDVIAQHGGYDATYFSKLAIEYITTDENQARGVPTHTSTNTD